MSSPPSHAEIINTVALQDMASCGLKKSKMTQNQHVVRKGRDADTSVSQVFTNNLLHAAEADRRSFCSSGKVRRDPARLSFAFTISDPSGVTFRAKLTPPVDVMARIKLRALTNIKDCARG
jgi:hypothetical protein